jgi:hypothetical protein
MSSRSILNRKICDLPSSGRTTATAFLPRDASLFCLSWLHLWALDLRRPPARLLSGLWCTFDRGIFFLCAIWGCPVLCLCNRALNLHWPCFLHSLPRALHWLLRLWLAEGGSFSLLSAWHWQGSQLLCCFVWSAEKVTLRNEMHARRRPVRASYQE